jgi:hypothetical protein
MVSAAVSRASSEAHPSPSHPGKTGSETIAAGRYAEAATSEGALTANHDNRSTAIET